LAKLLAATATAFESAISYTTDPDLSVNRLPKISKCTFLVPTEATNAKDSMAQDQARKGFLILLSQNDVHYGIMGGCETNPSV
jgi:hypothetical protein